MLINYVQRDTHDRDDHAWTRVSLWRRAGWSDRLFVAYGLLVTTAVAGSYLAASLDFLPGDPHAIRLDLLNAPPGTDGFALGTDYMGRDILSRLIVGTQAYFLPGLLAVAIALFLGGLIGLAGAYQKGVWARILAYGVHLIDAFPRMVLILLVVAVFRPDTYLIMTVAGVTQAPMVASMVKSKVFFLKQKNFIEAAIALGVKNRTLWFKHILWLNCRALLIIQATLCMAEAIMIETSLSYLGFGVQEPIPSWGNMVQSGANYFLQGCFWPSTIPALAILFTIFGFHLLGDGLNNILERKQSR